MSDDELGPPVTPVESVWVCPLCGEYAAREPWGLMKMPDPARIEAELEAHLTSHEPVEWLRAHRNLEARLEALVCAGHRGIEQPDGRCWACLYEDFEQRFDTSEARLEAVLAAARRVVEETAGSEHFYAANDALVALRRALCEEGT